MAKQYAFILSILVAMFTIMGLIAGGYNFLDERYALASSHHLLEYRVSIHELNHVYTKSMEDVFFYRAQSRIYPDDNKIKMKLDEANSNYEKIKKQIAIMEEKRQELKLKF